MQGYKYKKYTTIQAQGYMSTKLQNDTRIKTVTFSKYVTFVTVRGAYRMFKT